MSSLSRHSISDFISREQMYYAAATVVFVLLALLFMGKVADVRIRELEYALQDMNPERSASASLSLISRYKILQKRLSGSTDTKEDFFAESESLAIAAGGLLANNKSAELSAIDTLSIKVVNFFSIITGGDKVRDFKDEKGEEILRVAFLYERQRDYEKAITAYDTASGYFKEDKERLSYIFLHKGFCLALKNDTEQAISSLRLSQGLDPNGDNGRTSAALLAFLLNLQNQMNSVIAMKESTEKGELLYRMMSYSQAVETLNTVTRQKTDQKALFYRGRSQEELGNTQSAIQDYRAVIAMDAKSEWGIKANRRLYLLGSFYTANAKLAEESQKNAVATKDTNIFDQTRVLKETSEIEKLESIEKEESVQNTIETIKEFKEEIKENPSQLESELQKQIETQPVKVASLSPEELAAIQQNIERIKAENQRKLAIEKLRAPETPRQKRKNLLLENFEQLDKVSLEDGNIFYGYIENRGLAQLSLLTVLGKLSIPKDLILSEAKVPARKSFLDAPITLVNKIELPARLPSAERRKLLSPASSRYVRKEILKSNFDTLDKFILKDGNQFYGVIYSKDERIIRLVTVMGILQIPTDKVLAREKVASEAALP